MTVAIRENAKQYYDVDTSQSEAIVYVNWMSARNVQGFVWMWRNLPVIGRFLRQSEGLLDIHTAMSSPWKIVLVTYWRDHQALRDAYKDPAHVEMMRWAFKNPNALTLGNETYNAPFSTRYLNQAGGFSAI